MSSAVALRSKLFGAGAATGLASAGAVGQHTTEALRQATDRLLKEQASAEVSVGIYRTKLHEAQAAVKRLEEAYVAQNTINAKLQARVRSDYTALNSLSNNVTQTTAAYRQLKADHDALAASLAEADLERGALAAAFAAKAGTLAEVESAHAAACAAGRDLQARLDAAAAAHGQLTGEVLGLRSALVDKANMHEAAEARAHKLSMELAAMHGQRDAMALRLDDAASHINHLHAQLQGASTQLEDVQGAKAALEAVLAEQEGKATQLAADLAGAQEAAKAAEDEHAAMLEAKEAELAAASQTKAALEGELEGKADALGKLSTQLCELQQEVTATQAAQDTKAVELQLQLDAATQRHAQEVAALKKRHELAHDNYVAHVGEKLTGMQQESSKTKAELEEERKKAGQAQAAVEELKKKVAELEAAKTADKAALEARLAEQTKALEEERRKTAAAAEEERKRAEALAAVEGAAKKAQELAAQRGTELEELAVRLKQQEEANQKLDNENAANLHKLDSLNDTLRSAREKLEDAETRTTELAKTIRTKEAELEDKEVQLTSTQDRVAALQKDVEEKTRYLAGISQVAAHVAGGGSEAAAAAAAPEARARPAGGRSTAAAARPAKKVTFIPERADLAATSEDEEPSDGEEEDANMRTALVPVGGAAKGRGARGSQRPASQRATTGQHQRAPAAEPSRPVITEVDSGDEAEDHARDAAPLRMPSQRAAVQAAPPLPAEDDEDSEDEGRQARGRKRSGRAASTKSGAAAKKPRAGAAQSMRGLFSMQTASVGASGEVAKKKNSGRAAVTSVLTGYRKLVGGVTAAAAKTKKAAVAPQAAGLAVFDVFGFGGGFDDVSP